MKVIHAGGFDLMLRLGGEWENGERHHDFKGPQNVTQEANWIIAATKVAQRYAGKYTYLDIWTEYPGAHFWDRSNKEFNAFYVKAYKAIHTALPTAKLGGPGFNAVTSRLLADASSTNAAISFLRSLYIAGVAPTWLGWHDFNNTPEDFRTEELAYRSLLNGTGTFVSMPWAGTGFFVKAELLVEAYGSGQLDNTAALTPLPDDVLNAIHNGGRGATQIVATWMNLQATDAKGAFYYRFSDPKSTPGPTGDIRNGTGWYGLFYGDSVGTYKPSAYEICMISTMKKKYPTLKTIATPEETKVDGVYVTTATSHLDMFHGLLDRDLAILVANNSDTSYAWSPSDVSILSGKTVTVSTVSDTADGKTAVTHLGIAFQLDPWSVQLIEVK
ncbi:MAG: hypothetical protein EXS36_06535 [Pedosphaera sp.]|nr:hypothetical protein [Pedosphaera sp.]